ncbi:Fc.00g105700.m01.CDS01 [Cosmosporella sp. VM-42]
MADQALVSAEKPVLIIGAGISGLLLAQHLRREGVPFQVFERDADLTTRGVGWGLTLHWSLPALRALLPESLFQRLPESYVDRPAAERGASSTFPFFDLSTGELRSCTPKATESERIRVTREGLRRLLATGIEIKWEKPLCDITTRPDSVSATFEDGTSVEGRLLVACDGAQSRICVSWPYREGFLDKPSPVEAPTTNEKRHHFIQTLADTWAEPFRSLARNIPKDELIKDLIPQDFVPRHGLHSTRRTVLMGDAIHAMAMFRGEGANHSIVDVLDFAEHALPSLERDDETSLRTALDKYENAVISRAGPGVLASRQACIDAHDWSRIDSKSPLLTKRERNIKF